MKVSKKVGQLSTLKNTSKNVDDIPFEWYETQKRILHKTSVAGTSVQIKFLNANPNFQEGDILFETADHFGVVKIQPCKCLVITPANNQELAAACYEIGNRHIPLFIEDEQLLVAYEKPLHRYFEASNYALAIEEKKLLHPLKTTVSPHGGSSSLFKKIMQLNQPAS